jgi:LuxR family maltose regulon positive regulatory protein
MTRSSPTLPTWIAQTKLHPPRLRADAIERPRLLGALALAVASAPVTLLSAPAGSGKTTLLASWLRQLELRIENEELKERSTSDAFLNSQFPIPNSVAWLSLDEADDDPAGFLLALAAALGQLNPGCGAGLAQWLAAGNAPSAEPRRFAGVLVNEILQMLPEPFVLVLDDLHVLTAPPIFAFLDQLIERMPAQMRVVVATRYEPPLALGRLRARRQIAELHLDDLRFTPEETERLLNGTLRLGLSPAHIQLLHARTDGWIAGIGILAGSLDQLASAADRGAFLARVERAGRYVFDFLADEVLGRQDPFVRMFLLETSILPDLTPQACQAVTGRSDAAAILDDLYRRNLFLVALQNDEGRTTMDGPTAVAMEPAHRSSFVAHSPSYRYHDLFRDFLRERLARELPEWVRQLHGRAAKAEPLPARQIQHYLAAELWDEAAATVENVGEVLLAQGGARTVRGWIDAIPPDVRARRPQLLYLLGICARVALEWDRAEVLFEQARDGFVAAGDAAGEGAALAQLATLLLFMAYRTRVITVARRALECPIAPHQRAQLYLTIAWVEQGDGDTGAVLADMDGAVRVAEASSDPRVFGGLALLFHSPLVHAPGAIRRIERIAELAQTRIGRQGGALEIIALGLAAQVYCWRGHWDEAVAIARRLVALGEQVGGLGLLWGAASAHAIQAVDAAFHGDDAGAERAFATLLAGLALATPGTNASWSTFYRLTQARMRWLKGEVGPLRAIYASMASDRPDPERWSPTRVGRPLLEGMIALAEGRHADAERALTAADELQQHDGTTMFFGRAAILLGHLYRTTGRATEAVRTVAPTLAQCEADDTPGLLFWDGPAIVAPLLRLAAARGVHADFANRTLKLIEDLRFTVGDLRFEAGPVVLSPKSEIGNGEEPLTPREIEIVRLLAAGASNQLIAATLVISLHTVKRHITHILGKLGAASRLEAVARARELRIIG